MHAGQKWLEEVAPLDKDWDGVKLKTWTATRGYEALEPPVTWGFLSKLTINAEASVGKRTSSFKGSGLGGSSCTSPNKRRPMPPSLTPHTTGSTLGSLDSLDMDVHAEPTLPASSMELLGGNDEYDGIHANKNGRDQGKVGQPNNTLLNATLAYLGIPLDADPKTKDIGDKTKGASKGAKNTATTVPDKRSTRSKKLAA